MRCRPGIVGDRYYEGTGTYSPKPDVREVTLIERRHLTRFRATIRRCRAVRCARAARSPAKSDGDRRAAQSPCRTPVQGWGRCSAGWPVDFPAISRRAAGSAGVPSPVQSLRTDCGIERGGIIRPGDVIELWTNDRASDYEAACREMRLTTPDVLHLQLVHPRRPTLPEWSAARMSICACRMVVWPNWFCDDPDDSTRYEIAIKREATGRGGSIWAHDDVREGTEVHISAPRNNLPLIAEGERYILVAGGIGITPLLSMARTLKRWGKDFILHHCARSASEAPLLALSSETFVGRGCSAGSPEVVLASIPQPLVRMTRIRTSISAGHKGFWMPCSRP